MCSERVVWGDADKGYFPVTSTPWGPIGSLICWESYMPLARVALYQKGITIYISPNTVPSRFLRTFGQPYMPASRCASSSSVTSR